MSTFVGKDGTVKIGSNAIAEIKSFEVKEKADTVDSTSMSNGKYKTHNFTHAEWEGSLDAFYDSTDTNGQVALEIGDSVVLNLYPESDTAGKRYFTGTATVTEIGNSTPVDGNIEISFSFQGNGALTKSTV